jgi:hypothetical protein
MYNTSREKRKEKQMKYFIPIIIILTYMFFPRPLQPQILEYAVHPTQLTPTPPLCSTSSVKTYMDYRMITSKTSKQYEYINTNIVFKDGHLMTDDGHYAVALGSAFGPIGSKWKIVLNTGIEFNVVKVDEKADAHTNNGCEQRWDKSVIEFIIDTSHPEMTKHLASNGYIHQGNFNNATQWKGNIKYVKAND